MISSIDVSGMVAPHDPLQRANATLSVFNFMVLLKIIGLSG